MDGCLSAFNAAKAFQKHNRNSPVTIILLLQTYFIFVSCFVWLFEKL